MENTAQRSVIVFPRESINYAPMEVNGKGGALASIVKLFSKTMDGGFIKIEKAVFAWELLYDEILYIVSGEMYIEENGVKNHAKQGDIYYIKKGAQIVYGTESEVEFFYSIYPGNWRELNNL